MSPPLAFEGVTFSYPGTHVFRDLDLEFEAGGLVAVLGPNGSGKTTLVRLATRVVTAQAGTVRLGGEPVDRLSPKVVARRVAVVPQEERSLFAFSVLESVLLGRTPWTSGFGFESPEDLVVAGSALEAVGAADLATRDLSELSGGERQRVRVARALAQQAELMMLDEPTSHLDLKHRVEMLRLLRRLSDEEGLTVVVISHDLNLAARFADRLVLLHEGSVAADGAPPEVLTPTVLSEVYGTPVSVKEVSGTPFVIPD